MNKKGFTLIEVLIVVAIIGILASVVLVGLGPLQRQGRDARRISDLKQIQNGLELYYNKCGYYPGVAEAAQTCTGGGGGATLAVDAAGLGGVLTGSDIGVTNVPEDPNTSREYQYESDGTTYVLRAQLDDENNRALQDDIDTPAGGLATDCSDAPTPYYCVQL